MKKIIITLITLGILVSIVLVLFYFKNENNKNNKTTTQSKTTITTNKTTITNKTTKTTQKSTTNDNTKYDVNYIVDGSTVDSVNVLNNTKLVEPTEPSKEGYTFTGWFNNSSKWDFNSDVVKSNMDLTAKFEINSYIVSLVYRNMDITIDGIDSDSYYEYNSVLNLYGIDMDNSYTIKWIIDDTITYGNEFTLTVPAHDVTIYVDKDPIYIRENNVVYFGYYPQKLEIDEEIKDTLNTKAESLPTSENSFDWTDYNYYLNGQVTSYMWYIDIDLDNDNRYDYRGVYFNYYRHEMTTGGYDPTTNFYQSSWGYQVNHVYWFKYEMIKWDVIKSDDNKVMLIADLIVDAQEFYNSDSTEKFLHNGKEGYRNNYELSNIRIWLNNTFYNTSFNEYQKGLIQTTEVDNTTGVTAEYACDNTLDKVFLLSVSEARNLINNNTARKRIGSDYAKSQGLIYKSSTTYTIWRLRTPYQNERNSCIDETGPINGNGGSTSCLRYGIVPALWISL